MDETLEVPATVPVENCEIRREETGRQSDKDALRDYRIEIRFLSRGCIVSVGCKEIAFENVASAMEAINLYVAQPYEQQKAWRKLLDN